MKLRKQFLTIKNQRKRNTRKLNLQDLKTNTEKEKNIYSN